MKTHRLVSVIAFASATLVPAAGQIWSQRFPPRNPDGLVLAAMAYDARRGEVVLFGGFSVPGAFSDRTYVWDGAAWTEKSPASRPSPRFSPAMAFDSRRRQVVLFGGVGPDAPLGDTWTWDGVNWTQQYPANSPDPAATAMAYDAERDQVVVFGGNLNNQKTWVWNGANWMEKTPQASPSPAGRWGHMMAYDSVRKEVVLFGGNGLNGPVADTWTWNGAIWTQKSPAHSPPGRYYAGMAFDSGRNRVLLVGGLTANPGGGYSPQGATWAWDGTDWAPRWLTPSPGWRWAPGRLSCTRSDALAAGQSYPPISLTVVVARNAPALVVNKARVSGGGDSNSSNNEASDPTLINP